MRFEADASPPLEADHEVVTFDCMAKENRTPMIGLHPAGSLCVRTGTYNVYLPADKVHLVRSEEKLKVSQDDFETPVRQVEN